MDTSKLFMFDWEYYATLDEAIKEASKSARRRQDEQTIYKAAATVAPVIPETPVEVTIL